MSSWTHDQPAQTPSISWANLWHSKPWSCPCLPSSLKVGLAGAGRRLASDPMLTASQGLFSFHWLHSLLGCAPEHGERISLDKDLQFLPLPRLCYLTPLISVSPSIMGPLWLNRAWLSRGPAEWINEWIKEWTSIRTNREPLFFLNRNHIKPEPQGHPG